MELLGNNVDSKLRLSKFSAYVKWQPCKYTLKNFDKNKQIRKMKPLWSGRTLQRKPPNDVQFFQKWMKPLQTLKMKLL